MSFLSLFENYLYQCSYFDNTLFSFEIFMKLDLIKYYFWKNVNFEVDSICDFCIRVKVPGLPTIWVKYWYCWNYFSYQFFLIFCKVHVIKYCTEFFKKHLNGHHLVELNGLTFFSYPTFHSINTCTYRFLPNILTKTLVTSARLRFKRWLFLKAI